MQSKLLDCNVYNSKEKEYSKMFGSKKSESVFFDLFKEASAKLTEAGEVFYDLVENYEDVEKKVARVKDIETACDVQTHKMLRKLNESFVTPFDREDIYNLSRSMDDIVDCLEEVSNRFVVFDIKSLRPEALEMTKLIVRAIKELSVMFEHLDKLKTSKIVMEQIIEVNNIENEGDALYHDALQKLFREEKDPIELIKWMHILEKLEESLDSCENVANLAEGAVMKYA